MSDDFEKAVLFSFDQTGAVDPALKERAISYCESIKWSEGAWRGLMERFQTSQYPEVKFWCLQAVHEVFRRVYTSIGGEERMLVKGALLKWVREDCAIPNHFAPFIKNKLAQLVTCVVQFEYPKEWPSFFHDLLAGLQAGPLVADMFCRVMQALDEEVISLEYSQGREDNARSMEMKDAMRESCIGQVMEAFYGMAAAYQSSDPALAAAVLETMQRYVNWVDISLVVNSHAALLFSLLQGGGGGVAPRAAACEVLKEVVAKRMSSEKKVALLTQLDLAGVLARVVLGGDTAAGGEMAVPLATLLAALAAELYDSWRALVDAGAGGAAEAEAAAKMLFYAMPPLMACLGGESDEASRAVLPFLNTWVGSVIRAPAMAPAPDMAAQLEAMLRVLALRMRLPEDRGGGGDDGGGGGGSGCEGEDARGEHRDELATLLKNIARVAPVEGIRFVGQELATVLGGGGVGGGAGGGWREVECAIHLLHQIGEVVPNDSFRPDAPLGELVGVLVRSPVPQAGHRMVALAYMEAVVRYSRVVHQIPQCLPQVVAAFLDERGLRHPSPAVRTRASYLVMRLFKTTRNQLVPMAADVLARLRPTLEAVARGPPRSATLQGGEGFGHGGGTDEQLYVFEAAGLLLGQEELPAGDQLACVEGVMALLLQEMEAALGTVVVAMGYFSKGFSARMATTTRPEVGRALGGGLEAVLRALQRLPGNAGLRGRVVSFLHRMVECLRGGALPYLPAAIEALVAQSTPRDLCNVVVLLNQVMPKFKADLAPLLTGALPLVLARIFALLPGGEDASSKSASTEDARERQEVQRSLFGLLHAMGSAELLPVLLSPPCQAFLPQVTAALLQGAAAHEDALVRKICVQTFRPLIREWCGAAGAAEAVPGFRRYVVEHVGAECCVRSTLREDLDWSRDANAAAVLGELAATQKLIYERCGDDYLAHLCQVVLPSVQCPPALQEQYVMHVRQDDPKQLKAFLREAVEQMRPRRA